MKYVTKFRVRGLAIYPNFTMCSRKNINSYLEIVFNRWESNQASICLHNMSRQIRVWCSSIDPHFTMCSRTKYFTSNFHLKNFRFKSPVGNSLMIFTVIEASLLPHCKSTQTKLPSHGIIKTASFHFTVTTSAWHLLISLRGLDGRPISKQRPMTWCGGEFWELETEVILTAKNSTKTRI